MSFFDNLNCIFQQCNNRFIVFIYKKSILDFVKIEEP